MNGSDQPTLVPCQVCGYQAETSTRIRISGETYQAKPGDLNICLNCGAFGIFTPEMALRLPHPEECGKLPESAITFQFAIRYRGLLEKSGRS